MHAKEKHRTEGGQAPPASAGGEPGTGGAAAYPVSWRLWLAVIAAGALFGLYYTLSPKVVITVVPGITHMEVRTAVTLDGELAALAIERTDALTARGAVPATGRAVVGVTAAKGVVVFFNTGEAPVLVPKGTQVATQSGQLYATDQDVVVPGREAVYFLDLPVGVQAGRAEATVTAQRPGSEGNVGPERVRVIVGDWPTLSVRNLEPFTGGTDATVPAVVQADLDAAVGEARRALEAQREALVAGPAGGAAPLTLLAWEWADDERAESAAQAGDRVPTAEAVVTRTLRTVWADAREFGPILEKVIPERVPIGYTWERTMGFSVHVEGYDSERRELRLRAEVPLRPIVDGVRLAQAVAGRPAEEAVAHLTQQSGIESATVSPPVERLPRWAPWIRIAVRSDRP